MCDDLYKYMLLLSRKKSNGSRGVDMSVSIYWCSFESGIVSLKLLGDSDATLLGACIAKGSKILSQIGVKSIICVKQWFLV